VAEPNASPPIRFIPVDYWLILRIVSNVQQLIVATRNPHKIREIRQILGSAYNIRDLSACPDAPAVVESGETFEQNAALKAEKISRCYTGLVLADDSGLAVNALNGAPGVRSARYAAENATDQQNLEKLLAELRKSDPRQQDWSASFRCAVAIAENGKVLEIFCGEIKGMIVNGARGTGGFGYDPVFVPDGYRQTFAELGAEEKNRISHRAQALRKAREALKTRVATAASSVSSPLKKSSISLRDLVGGNNE